ncbi:methyltransferase domain-containing protein [Pseudodesulfovibrio sp. zrk46]|uniref:methyltransferase domain-containing protein n=1 Tax=Pseudodesulfovibrio sp. zrk46 TaxID=2725288 RepID=UPI001449494D|nr:methyltransferase domain-containing protein [Pseudodesulfovibrio sp. zrk46]QJB56128.1 methyltransferase domain-containing protein [Pseudodesulfovibrio sp. zrk46]
MTGNQTVAIIRANIQSDTNIDQKLHDLISTLRAVPSISNIVLAVPDNQFHRALNANEYPCELFLGSEQDMNLRLIEAAHHLHAKTIVDCSLLTWCNEPELFDQMIHFHESQPHPFTTPSMWSNAFLPKIINTDFLKKLTESHTWPYYLHVLPDESNSFTPDFNEMRRKANQLDSLGYNLFHETMLAGEGASQIPPLAPPVQDWIKRTQDILNIVDSLFAKKDISMLEVGCGRLFGAGLLLNQLGISNYTGIDLLRIPISNEEIETFHQLIQRWSERGKISIKDPRPLVVDCNTHTHSSFFQGAVQHHIMSATEMSFQDNHYDFVYTGGVMEHIGDYHGAIQEMFRVMKPGAYGWHYIGFDDHLCPSPGEPRQTHLLVSKETWQGQGHDYINLVRPQEMYQAFLDTGFEIISNIEIKDMSLGINQVHPDHAAYGISDIQTIASTLIVRKPME